MKSGLLTIIWTERDHGEVLLIHQMLAPNQTFIKRRLCFQFGGIGSQFSTRNYFQPEERLIQMFIVNNWTIWKRNFLINAQNWSTGDPEKFEGARLGCFTVSTIFSRSCSLSLSLVEWTMGFICLQLKRSWSVLIFNNIRVAKTVTVEPAVNVRFNDRNWNCQQTVEYDKIEIARLIWIDYSLLCNAHQVLANIKLTFRFIEVSLFPINKYSHINSNETQWEH